MSIVRLNIKELIGTSNAIIQKFGYQVFEVASLNLSKGNSIILDFASISNLTSGFCNASVGRLYTEFPEIADRKIIIDNISKDSIWFEKIQDSIELAKNPDKAKCIDDAILALFE